MPQIYDNEWQGKHKRVLCLCSANMLRSPTMQVVLSSEPFNYNTRSAGTYDFALIPISAELLSWADEIVCADTEHVQKVLAVADKVSPLIKAKPIVNLHIPDIYEYRHPELMLLIEERYVKWLNERT